MTETDRPQMPYPSSRNDPAVADRELRAAGFDSESFRALAAADRDLVFWCQGLPRRRGGWFTSEEIEYIGRGYESATGGHLPGGVYSGRVSWCVERGFLQVSPTAIVGRDPAVYRIELTDTGRTLLALLLERRNPIEDASAYEDGQP